jgi:hypothetical protein
VEWTRREGNVEGRSATDAVYDLLVQPVLILVVYELGAVLAEVQAAAVVAKHRSKPLFAPGDAS